MLGLFYINMHDLYNSLKELTRRELLGVWIDAQEKGNKRLEDLVMKVMSDTQSSAIIKKRGE